MAIEKREDKRKKEKKKWKEKVPLNGGHMKWAGNFQTFPKVMLSAFSFLQKKMKNPLGLTITTRSLKFQCKKM